MSKISFIESQCTSLTNYEPVRPLRMEFIAFELYSLIFSPEIYVGGEVGDVYPFTTTCQTSNPCACKNALSLMLQEA